MKNIISKKFIPLIWFAGFIVGSSITSLTTQGGYFITSLIGVFCFIIFSLIIKLKKQREIPI